MTDMHDATRTPGVWKACGSDTSLATWVELDGNRVCTMKRGEADWQYAEFIANTCNSYETITAALETLMDGVEDVAGGSYLNYRLLLSERVKAARAALARVKEST